MGYSVAIKNQVVQEYYMWENIYDILLSKKNRRLGN